MKTIARISGIAYLFIFITGFYANFAVVESLIDLSDASITFENISKHPGQFFNGIIGFVIMILFDALLVWALYKLLEDVNRRLSLLASGFRLINVLFFGMALSKLIMVYLLMKGSALGESSPDRVLVLVQSFDRIWIMGLIFFGVHLALLGFLIIKSSIVPNWLGYLLIIASAGYVIDGVANLYYDAYEAFENIFMLIVVIPGVLGEFSLTIWLLFNRKY
jgi:hypothetical protein